MLSERIKAPSTIALCSSTATREARLSGVSPFTTGTFFCTVHFVTSECDGGKIIVQKKVPVVKGDTPESLASRVAVEEHKAIVEGALILSESI